jgi:acetyl-CoA carboxylase/biotin carboxylase 1
VDGSPGSEEEADSLRAAIDARENSLLPLYAQISYEFADLHDRPGRMLAKARFISRPCRLASQHDLLT